MTAGLGCACNWVPPKNAVAIAVMSAAMAVALGEEAEYDPLRWRHHGWPDETVALLTASAVPLPPPS